jgi:16S rRNA (cytosine1402-N4)-methyltransferase
MFHEPVMVDEVLTMLLHDYSKLVVDCTAGCGGHVEAILKAAPAVRVVGIDRDSRALAVASDRLEVFGDRVKLLQGSYTDMGDLLAAEGIAEVDGVLLDLGLSSYQLDDPDRGFSYLHDGPLDMRMGTDGKSARELIAESTADELAAVLKNYGEVRGARRIARSIKASEKTGEMRTTAHLRSAVDAAVGGKASSALLSKVFQSIRIFVNQELDNLKRFLGILLDSVKSGGRLVFISYHSLEDREIKNYFKVESSDCICPPSSPVCRCNHFARLEVLTRRALKPSPSEIESNPRARSARLRAACVI